MKHFIKAFMMLSFLNFRILTLTMEKDDIENVDDSEQNIIQTMPKNFDELGLPTEIWCLILQHLYYQANILNGANDIYEGLTIVQTEIPIRYKTISLTCKPFNSLNIPCWAEFKEKIREFYIIELNHKFLEAKENQEGLFPKKSTWGINFEIDNKIAKFILNKNTSDPSIIAYLLVTRLRNDSIDKLLIKNLIKLLLFYGADVNIPDGDRDQPLTLAIWNHHIDSIDIIVLLLKHGADANIPDMVGITPLARALMDTNINTNLIIFLLRYGANPNLQDSFGTTPRERARKKGFNVFDKLVQTHYPTKI